MPSLPTVVLMVSVLLSAYTGPGVLENDLASLTRLLDTRQPLTDNELALFLSPARRPRVFTLEHPVLKPHLGRFRAFGNRPFAFPTWQCGTSGYGVTFIDFERRADEGGSRALTAEELALIASLSGGE